MQIRNDLYIRDVDRSQINGSGHISLRMPEYLKCKEPPRVGPFKEKAPFLIARSRELADGRVVCMACEHGPCQLPGGIGADRELHIYKES